jgi:hypothetical protein
MAQSRVKSFLIEMAGSAAICWLAYALAALTEAEHSPSGSGKKRAHRLRRHALP